MGQVIPVASEIKKLPEGRCISILLPPVFDTTPPGVGGRLKPRCARHGNFTPPRIAPSRPRGREYHCVLTRSLRNSLSAVSGRVGTARRLIWPSLMGRTPQAGLGASSRVALRFSGASSGNVFQSPDVTGRSPVFFKVHRGYGTTPSLLSRVREGVDRENF